MVVEVALDLPENIPLYGEFLPHELNINELLQDDDELDSNGDVAEPSAIGPTRDLSSSSFISIVLLGPGGYNFCKP